jgi:hypothetical protein
VTEQQIIDWLAAHPFLKSQIILAFGTVSSYVLKDLESFKKYKLGDPEATFDTTRSAKEIGKGIALALIPSFIAKVWQILGA